MSTKQENENPKCIHSFSEEQVMDFTFYVCDKCGDQFKEIPMLDTPDTE